MAGRPAGQVTDQEAGAAAERAARESYGRLVALLAASTRDIALAEDALADAFERALRTWPTKGVPDNPQGWLMTVARNRIRDVLASAAVRTAAALDDNEGGLAESDPDAVPDKRLELLFACAHPAINPAVRPPLMLQVVLGFDVARIAGVFAVQPAAMAQRLVRTKRRIRDAGSRSGPRRGRTCPHGCRRCSKPSTAPMRSTGLTSTSESVNPSRTRPGGWPWSPRACSTPSPRRGASPRCSPSRSRGRPPARTGPGRPSTSRTRRYGTARSWPRERRYCAAPMLLARPSDGSSSKPPSSRRTAIGRGPGPLTPTILQLYRGLVAIAPTSGAVEALRDAHRVTLTGCPID